MWFLDRVRLGKVANRSGVRSVTRTPSLTTSEQSAAGASRVHGYPVKTGIVVPSRVEVGRA